MPFAECASDCAPSSSPPLAASSRRTGTVKCWFPKRGAPRPAPPRPRPRPLPRCPPRSPGHRSPSLVWPELWLELSCPFIHCLLRECGRDEAPLILNPRPRDCRGASIAVEENKKVDGQREREAPQNGQALVGHVIAQYARYFVILSSLFLLLLPACVYFLALNTFFG